MSRSIYQTNGKALSQQAIYQQKLKQGIYGSPGAPSVGVNSNAPDTAALLAASADLTVKPSYERSIAQEAQEAALAAKMENITAWSRENTDPYADAAAATARSNTFTGTANYEYKASVGTGVPSLKGDKIYKVASQKSASSMTSRINPEKDIKRSGLATKASITSLNIEKINEVANKNSTKSLNERFNPELDYRSGLNAQSHQPPTEFLNQEEENMAATSAAASLKHGAGYTNLVSSQRRTQSFKASDIVNSTLLSAASDRANDRLKSITSGGQIDLKAQAIVYANALAVAQKNSNERIKRNNLGLVELGGGLTMTRDEIERMASLVVQPVLKDIDTKAEIQRESDKAYKQKQHELAQLHQEAKQEEIVRKNKEKADIEQAKKERIVANEENKKAEEDKYNEYQTERNKEVDDKVAELKVLEATYAEQKNDLLAEKQANQDRIDEEELELTTNRKQELDELQAEKDEILAPTLEELKQENAKLKDLEDARDELKNEVNSAEDLNKEYEAKLSELNEKLESAKAEIEQYTEDLEEATTKHEESTKQVDELQQLSIDELLKAEEAHNDLDGKLEELNKIKEEHLATKTAKKEEILNLIDERVKEEHEINEELPDHLKKDINEHKLRDTGSLFSAEEPSVKEIPLINPKEVKSEEPSEKPISDGKTEPKPAMEKPAISTTTNSPSPKKKGGLKRLTQFLKSPVKEKPASPTQTNTEEIPKPPKKSVGSTADEPSREPVSQESNKPRPDSEASNGEYDDDISLSKNQNQGGLFKEEI